MKKVKKLSALFLAMVMLFALVACGADPAADAGNEAENTNPDAENLVIKMGHAESDNENSCHHMADTKFAELVNEYSDGRITIEVFANGQLGGERDMVEGLQIGTVDIIKHAPDLVSMQIALSRGHIAIPDCSLLDERGELRQSAKDVVTVAKKHNAVVATGHISHEECFAVAQEAYRQGVEKLVITHANLPATRYSVAEQKKLIDLGAIIERSYIVLYKGMIDAETEAAEIAAVGADHVFLSSDFGRPEAPFFDEGLLAYINALCDQGVSEQDTYRMVSVNPTYLVE